ncbi:Alkaline ceramidase 3 [Mortierella antarctica]|nr:Alkaline ceramidase 3 [Mortierella antarctica]
MTTAGNNIGYWGPPTSSIDWCEDNYVVSFYIAEFFNSFSSFAMIILGETACYSIDRLQSDMERTLASSTTMNTIRAPSLFRFKLAFRTITVVGIGSFLFHATLLHHMQMLDELPMLYSVLTLFFCLIESRFGPRPAWFARSLAVLGVVVTILVAFTEGDMQFYSFHGTFGPLEVATLYLIFRVYLARKSEYPDVRKVFEAGIGLYAIAVAVWVTDLSFCTKPLLTWLGPLGVNEPRPYEGAHHEHAQWIFKDLYLHAWWHILVSMGLYLLSTVIMLDGLIIQGWQPQLQLKGGWLPVVTVLGMHSDAKSKTSKAHRED